jgi:hypothetical protein
MARVQVIAGVERRRRWSQETKRALVAAAFGRPRRNGHDRQARRPDCGLPIPKARPRVTACSRASFTVFPGICCCALVVRGGEIRRLIVNLPPRHVKSLLASVAFPAWCLGHEPSAQILCVTPGFNGDGPSRASPGGDREIARSLSIARSTVALTVERAAAADPRWPFPLGIGGSRGSRAECQFTAG